MTLTFLSAVVDTLLPGEEGEAQEPRRRADGPRRRWPLRARWAAAAPTKRMGEAGRSLPPASAVGVAVRLADHLAARLDDWHLEVLRAVASAAGGEEAFVRANEDARIAAMRLVEGEMHRPFAALVSRVLQDYYEAEAVIIAMGWRVEPPQPDGHALPPFDDALLAPVKRRRRMWR